MTHQKWCIVQLGWFDYKSPTMDEPLFNIMYCASVNGKTLQGVFNVLHYSQVSGHNY